MHRFERLLRFFFIEEGGGVTYVTWHYLQIYCVVQELLEIGLNDFEILLSIVISIFEPGSPDFISTENLKGL